MSLSESLVYLWLLPVTLQVVLPLGILAGFLGRKLFVTILGGTEVTKKSAVGMSKA